MLVLQQNSQVSGEQPETSNPSFLLRTSLEPGATFGQLPGIYQLESGCLRYRRAVGGGKTITLRHQKVSDFFHVSSRDEDFYEAVTPVVLSHLSAGALPDQVTLMLSLALQLSRSDQEREMSYLPLEQHVLQALHYLATFCPAPGDTRVFMDPQTLAESINRELNAVSHTLDDLARRGRIYRRKDDLISLP